MQIGFEKIYEDEWQCPETAMTVSKFANGEKYLVYVPDEYLDFGKSEEAEFAVLERLPSWRLVELFNEAFGIETFTIENSGSSMLTRLNSQLEDIADGILDELGSGRVSSSSRPAILSMQLLISEVSELAAGFANGRPVEVLDALTDIQYVLDGIYVKTGLRKVKSAALAEVHLSNMSKLGSDGKPIISPAGRVEKGPHYRLPSLTRLIDRG